MKQISINIIIALTTFAVLGLISIQFYWFSNSIKLEEEKFNKNVGSALAEIVESLEQKEAANTLLEEISEEDNDFVFIINSDTVTKVTVNNTNRNNTKNNQTSLRYELTASGDSVTKKVNVVSNIKIEADSNFAQSIIWKQDADSLIFYKTKIIENVCDKLIITEQNKSIKERIKKSSIDSLCKEIFPKYGINAEYNFNILNKQTDSLLYPATSNKIVSTPYSARLFPNGIFANQYFLIVNFTNRRTVLLSSVLPLLLSSIVLTLLIIILFYLTIKMLLKQKKIADIKNDLLTNISHEFKTPISTISLAADVLGEGETKYFKKYTKVIKTESERLTNMVEDVLTTASLERDEINLNKESIDLHKLIIEVINNFELTLTQKGSEVITKLNAHKFMVLADENQMKNVFTNIIDNSIKYNNNKPKITIETRSTNDKIIISISDNGIGIDKKNINKIFDTFYRVPTGNVHNVKGYGIGLNVVKKIIEAHSGKVEVTSEINKGTILKIYLPFLQ